MLDNMIDNVLIIPYRAREKHLKYYIDNTVPVLKKIMPNSKVVVVEQDWNNKLFNRGCLLNIGVKEYENKCKYIITHDVDINPCEKTIIDYYMPDIEENFIKGLYNLGDGCDTLGGIIKMHSATFFKMNGFPNDIWGWGAEDIALKYRANYFNITVKKNIRADSQKNGFTINNCKINEYDHFKIFNDINDRNGINNGRNISKYNLSHMNSEQKLNNINSSGLNNLKYKILETKDITDYTELIRVSI